MFIPFYAPVEHSWLYSLFYDWQTLWAGLFALGAAWRGAYYINKQIRQSEAHEQRRWNAKVAAARSVLPLSLSSIGDYAEESAKVLRVMYNARDGEVIPRHTVNTESPLIPTGAISNLQELIEAAPLEVAGALQQLISMLQIQNARLRGMVKDLRSDIGVLVVVHNVESRLIDAAIIYAMASRLFAYGRHEMDGLDGNLDYDAVSRALRIWHFHEFDFPRVYETIQHRADNNTPLI